MKKIFFAVLLCILSAAVSAQEAPEIENGEPYNKASVKPFLNALHDANDYVLTYRPILPDYPDAFDYFILTKKGNVLTAYNYSEQNKKLTKLTVPADSIKLLWKAYTDFNIFKIKDEKYLSVFCPDKYVIFGSYTYEIMLLSGDRMKKLSYYDPEYYNRVCSGMIERQYIINCVSLINYVLHSVVVQPYRTTAY